MSRAVSGRYFGGLTDWCTPRPGNSTAANWSRARNTVPTRPNHQAFCTQQLRMSVHIKGTHFNTGSQAKFFSWTGRILVMGLLVWLRSIDLAVIPCNCNIASPRAVFLPPIPLLHRRQKNKHLYSSKNGSPHEIVTVVS